MLILAGTEEVLEWIGDGLKSQVLSFPEKIGPIFWPQYSLIASMNPPPVDLELVSPAPVAFD
jgi:hypothetical protein